ncbi:MAG TPA: DNA mismatch repair endonuclease MutL, partial [Legionella sp.]|nr:DNA mismatch repair endonuclease MutL [Legionella sp.]
MNPVRIQRLSALVSNQIAAGEVIERPASVVKELLENALDASADVISVEIGFGGLNQIKVSDNGTGIVADDLPLAVALHATSKISQLNDLYAIRSMGFRGEALASIASVSRLSVSSKPEHQAHAMMLQIDGIAVHCVPCARSRGTTVDVRDLFYNAPVRKKFLKSEQREYQAIEAVVKRFALSAPAVALSLIHNDKSMFALPAAPCEKTRLLRIRKLLGKAFTDDAIHLDVERAGMRLQGWVSGPDYQRSQNDKQWIYINQRMVKDKLLNHAMKQAYDGVLHPGRHPVCVLYLTIPAGEVDVNVHPTKHEVRFQQPRLVHDFMTSQMVCALASCKPVAIETPTYPLEIRESHPIYTRPTPFSREREKVPAGQMRVLSDGPSYPLLVLNHAFAVVTIDGLHYLLDIERLQQHHLSQQLDAQTYPLASRPLLLPVRYATDTLMLASLER